MLFAENVTKSYGAFDLFKNVSFNITDGERVALVGGNGAGKTTLLRLLAGEDSPTSGAAGHRNGSLGYLKQESGFNPDNTLEAEMWEAFPEARAIELRLQAIERLQADPSGDPSINAAELSAQQSELFDRYDLLGGYEIEARVDRALRGLGFKPADRVKPCGEFSGGWRMRISLAKVLVRQPHHLLLDEPTNHLDANARNYLARELSDYQGTLVIVTHDGAFLDKVAKRVLEVGGGGVTSYTGNYSAYLLQKERRRKLLEQAAARQEKQLARQQEFIDRFRYGTRASQAQSREKQLARVTRVERPAEERAARFTITSSGRLEQKALALVSVSHAYGDQVALLDVNLTVERGHKVALVGPNGSGKSTLLKIAARQLRPLEGDVIWSERAQFGYYDQHQDEALDPKRTVLEEVQAAAGDATEGRVRSALGKFLFKGDSVFKPISVLSGGERSRVALAKFLLQPTNVLLLDEPTNHLDRATRESLVSALKSYEGAIVCATHDSAIIEGVASHVYEVRDGECVNIVSPPPPAPKPAPKTRSKK